MVLFCRLIVNVQPRAGIAIVGQSVAFTLRWWMDSKSRVHHGCHSLIDIMLLSDSWETSYWLTDYRFEYFSVYAPRPSS
ncbi:hypothetical protein I7I50_02534 [Histoplasma capsulatum G186AR]|uniref:Uncharacterized protein n=1 Tax=Ajellomyces capsulatus TaxID=5037 RepID=A0A8H7Z5H3_AJECA|nr:hypothetical protein I7I52_00803 [Histoplasma capsulatum]QSS71619.1 hypothetical protein I7I50_02534 [Histoplasma capsulatum G186AR]